jgi:hypothetical protein
MAWTISGIAAILAQFVISCCAMVTYYPIFTFIYRNPYSQENFVDKYSTPEDPIIAVLLIFCYIKVSTFYLNFCIVPICY